MMHTYTLYATALAVEKETLSGAEFDSSDANILLGFIYYFPTGDYFLNKMV